MYERATLKYDDSRFTYLVTVSIWVPAGSSKFELEEWAKLNVSNDTTLKSMRLHPKYAPPLDPDYEAYWENGRVMSTYWSNSD